jgi:Family of unknown function (DUF6416)
MCIGCVMGAGSGHLLGAETGVPGELVGVGGSGPGEPEEWSSGDPARAAIVYRQLPRWSRRLLDLLSAAPGRRFPGSELQERLFAGDDVPFGVEDACRWAEAFCAATGRQLPVRQEAAASGETVYWMDQPAARVFQAAAGRPAA